VGNRVVPAISERLRQYATAITDPTRGMILIELDRVGEATATQLARRLGLTANNVYHHIRVLSQLGVIEPPRIVPGPTYVEKFYRITDETRAALHLDYAWYEHTREVLTSEDRKALIISLCLTLAHLLRQAARDYEALDADTLDRAVRDERLLLLSVNRVSRAQLESRLAALRSMFDQEAREFAEDLGPRTDLMIMAALPLLAALDSE
jgi:DNA-binding transcriptional ArsR family regulator